MLAFKSTDGWLRLHVLRSPRQTPRRAGASGLRGLYKAAENAIGPRLPRPLRAAWRRFIGRPPLPSTPPAPPVPSDTAPAPKRFDVVCFPIIAWSFRFQRPQQLMRELARRSHRVLWIDPDTVKSGSGAGLRTEIDPGVFEVGLCGRGPRDPFRDALSDDDVEEMTARLAALQQEVGLAGVVAIVQLPFWAPLARRLARELGWRIVYDCMDDHSSFSTNDPKMLEGESWLLRESALVVTTSARLRAYALEHGSRVISVPNACDYDHFARAAEPRPAPESLAQAAHPIVGYVGAISDWFDFDLLRHAVVTHPEWSFVLVGSTWGAPDHADLAAAQSVHFLGEQPYDRLPDLLAQFDVACIPFRITPLIEATDPVKLYEYLAAGKPVVASRLPELEAHREHVALVDTPEEFTDAVARAIADDGAPAREARAAFARANTWRRRADVLEAGIERVFPRASVCVVTWNNRELTRACLDSVLADRTWPNLEVVVVDNASSDDTPGYLNELAAHDERVQVELNLDNRGFAAANNQALVRATGAYVVLLNNDTVVPRGWLARLIAVLDADPRIGLVGPVTNGVWNEARVEGLALAPDRVDDAARVWAREHAGRVLPIGMLAMYCVATRRSVVDEVGPLDERFGIGMFEDDDYAHRVRRAGYRLACAEEVLVYHAGQASFDKLARKDALWRENRGKFEDKWGTSWRPPVLGDRARTLAHRNDVERQIAASGAPAVVVCLDDPARRDPAAEALVHGLAARGHLVIEVHEPAPDPDDRRLHAVGERLVSTLPLESFDRVLGAIVLPCAARSFDLAYFADARVVYFDEPDAPPRGRAEVLAQAEMVIGSDVGGVDPAIVFAPDDLAAALARLERPRDAGRSASA